MLCSKCLLEKEESLFKRDKERKSGFSSWCKTCNTSYSSKNQQKNKEKISKYKKSYKNNRLKSDNLFKLRNSISCLIKSSLKCGGYSKRSKTKELLCCSYEYLLVHIGPKPEGNYHLDHICPCSQAQNEEELIKLQHYSNLRWLSAEENLSKGDKRTIEGNNLCRILLCREWID